MDSLNYACLLGQSSSFVHRGKKSAVYYSIEISASDLNFNMRFVVPFSLRLFLEPTEIMPWETYKKIIKGGNIDPCS